MNKLCVAALSAYVTSATQIVSESQFLQADSTQEDYSSFGSASCQFVLDGSWYSFVDTSNLDSTAVYTSTDKLSTAYFTYCQNLSNTDTTACSSDYYAAISLVGSGSTCLLNANDVTLV